MNLQDILTFFVHCFLILPTDLVMIVVNQFTALCLGMMSLTSNLICAVEM